MGWISESFKTDKRFLELQLKRGKIKHKDVDAILATLPDVSSKAQVMIGIDAAGDETESKLSKPKKEEE